MKFIIQLSLLSVCLFSCEKGLDDTLILKTSGEVAKPRSEERRVGKEC